MSLLRRFSRKETFRSDTLGWVRDLAEVFRTVTLSTSEDRDIVELCAPLGITCAYCALALDPRPHRTAILRHSVSGWGSRKQPGLA